MQDIHTYIHISGTYLGLTANTQVGVVSDILTRWSSSRNYYNVMNNSILDVCGSPRYEPAYLAIKYITKKNRPLPPLHLDNIYSDFKIFMLYCSR